jgi:hypothetical protein
MELSFLSYVKILRLNILKIIFSSLCVSIFISYFINSNKFLFDVYVKIENFEPKNISSAFEKLNFKTKEANKKKNEILLLARNFDSYSFKEFEYFKIDLKSVLEKNRIINSNELKSAVDNSGLTYILRNIYFDDEIKKEVIRIVTDAHQNYHDKILKEFNDINFNSIGPEIFQTIKKREEEYTNIKNNLSQLSIVKIICFDNCFEVTQKNEENTLKKNEEVYFNLENKELKSLYDSFKTIDINEKKMSVNFSVISLGPMFNKFKLFLFIFLMMFSLSAIFFLLKKNLDEKYRKD